MSRPLIPRPTEGDSGTDSLQAAQKPRKISTACGACKQRKTKCTGNTPCEACATRSSPCVYDVTTDQRRKIANQRNMQDLVEAHVNLERYKHLLGGVLATFRAGDLEEYGNLLTVIRSGVDLSQLAAHVRNARRANPAIDQAYAAITFMIDGEPEELPSANQLLTNMHSGSGSRGSISSASAGDMQAPSGFLNPTVNQGVRE